MKVSLSMWSVHKYWYDGEWDVFDFLRFAAGTKAEGVELLSIFWKDRNREIPLVKEALGHHGLQIACFCACNNFVTADAEERQKQLQEVMDSIDTAVQLGTRIVRVFSGDLPHDGTMTYEEGMKYVLDGLATAAQYAEMQGVVLCLENHGLFAGRSDQVMNIIREVNSPSLRSTFDTGNFLLVGESSNDAITQLKDVVGHVHVKDFEKIEGEIEGAVDYAANGEKYLGRIAGEGQIDLRFILTELFRNNYSGWLSVEFEGNEEQQEGSLRAVEYVHSLTEQIKRD